MMHFSERSATHVCIAYLSSRCRHYLGMYSVEVMVTYAWWIGNQLERRSRRLFVALLRQLQVLTEETH